MEILASLKQEFNLYSNKLVPFIMAFGLPLSSIFLVIYFWSEVKWIDIFVFSLFNAIGFVAISTGYHRYFSHYSFKCKKWLRYTLVILGNMQGHGSVRNWVKLHHFHHYFTDKPGDPHSPNIVGISRKKWIRSLYAHVGWLFMNNCIEYSYQYGESQRGMKLIKSHHRVIRDLEADPLLVKLDNVWGLWFVLGLILPGIMTGLWTQNWMGMWMGILWGGLLSRSVVFHGTCLVNSLAHSVGKRYFYTKDNSRTNRWLGCFTGEGWHNAHHCFPMSAKFSLQKGQTDLQYFMIDMLSKLGVVWDVKVPSLQQIQEKTYY